ncbi:unnamed protein product [Adineta steineri]|uniref:Uncharacterized protein n=2 Tax=Adineta steineri TaxID=433720 RepID=A0A819SC54_9BILA|nr:unnamed protein product [Adineta steineri]CAF4059760.1 unnamed protein product [Adineta steineri]
MVINGEETHTINSSDEANDPTASYNELESFDSIWQALRWKQIRTRVPICCKKTVRSRYMLANLVYLVYAIGILIIDFNPNVNGSSSDNTMDYDYDDNTTTMISVLDQPVIGVPLVNRFYIGLAAVHILSAFLYWWSWAGRSWLDIIMIPEYLNHVEAGLYLWSAIWYSREDTLGGYYTLAIHKIEMTAATVELIASFGWIMSWYMTYVRTLGRGFTLDDPDTVAWLATTISSIIYMIYNIQINVQPEQYGTNLLYTYGDIVYFVGACYYIFATLRDENWFWFLPLSGQYGVAPGRVQVESTKSLPTYGKPTILITDLCKRCRIKNNIPKKKHYEPPQNNIFKIDNELHRTAL